LRFLETMCVFSSSLSYSVSPSIQVINGTTVHSPAFYGGKNYTSASGEQLTFTSNSSGTYVSTNSSNTARIMRSDVLTSNGVVHVIDSVLCDTQSNPGVASSACVSIMCQCVIQYWYPCLCHAVTNPPPQLPQRWPRLRLGLLMLRPLRLPSWLRLGYLFCTNHEPFDFGALDLECCRGLLVSLIKHYQIYALRDSMFYVLSANFRLAH
jgi:hypothetical protein